MNFGSIILSLVAFFIENVVATDVSNLPIIFFHGLSENASNINNFAANLTAEGRTIVPLSFCESSCSFESVAMQVPLAIAAVRQVVANNSAFENGYIFLAHSQGGAISRAVIEEMDDHQVKRYISLAGVQNGIFPGPNDADIIVSRGTESLQFFLPRPDIFNFSTYAPEQTYGKLQRDVVQFGLENNELQYQHSYFNLQRSPQFGSWASSNTFFPVVNNVNLCLPGNDQCVFDQRRRKANFLKLESAYFIMSPQDGAVYPWESSHFGRYSEVASVEEIETKFSNLTIVDMKNTIEYTADTFGLQTLDKRGGLYLPTVDNITHICWIRNDGNDCAWQDAFEYIYPMLH
ncbi:Lysosomal thioesterase PPT2-A [Phytophthora citrophthora]|uniref:Lysosomal thioesterase PPT2-A n=1 Tax=Phytophthora citrophthora TaxID=4793 RepID=A0AAD9GKQ7_9STRA|nr:Lysosomal thioesterase PPT2-A [Phytophthora citrophthora]